MTRLALLVLAFVTALSWAGPARAHDPFELTAVVSVREDAVVVATTMARATALRLAGGDGSPRATFAPATFAEHAPAFRAFAPALFELRSGERALRSKQATAELTDENDVEVVVSYEAHAGERFSIHGAHLTRLPEGYTSAITLKLEGATTGTHFKLLTAPDAEFSLDLGEARAGAEPPPAAEPEQAGARLRRFTLLGVEHVLTGYDHLLFLLGVLLACRTIKSMLWLVSCFTLAHSITLALATLGRVSAPASVVEPLIAASIVFVGVENLGKEPHLGRRMAVTFAFGLIHGLGFASVLRELELPRDAIFVPLFAFNVGVELGQLLVAAIALPFLLFMHASARRTTGLRYSSVLVSAVGCFWLCERLLAA